MCRGLAKKEVRRRGVGGGSSIFFFFLLFGRQPKRADDEGINNRDIVDYHVKQHIDTHRLTDWVKRGAKRKEGSSCRLVLSFVY